jgi:hypothetical protein
MKAALLTEVGKLVVEDTAVPLCGRDEVLIRVKLGGICGSDHTLYHGRFGVPLPVIPGHEAVGIVETTGEGVTGILKPASVSRYNPTFPVVNAPCVPRDTAISARPKSDWVSTPMAFSPNLSKFRRATSGKSRPRFPTKLPFLQNRWQWVFTRCESQPRIPGTGFSSSVRVSWDCLSCSWR